MRLTSDFSLQQVFGEAVNLFDLGDLNLAFRYFNTYLSGGGPEEDAAREYLRKIGEQAVVVGKLYHDYGLLRHAKEHYTLAVNTGAEEPVLKAREFLRRMPAPKLGEFKAAPGKGPPRKAAGKPAAGETPDWRRPHLRLSNEEPLKAGERFEASVFADQSEPEPGEECSTIELPGKKRQYDLEVTLLASAHFLVDEPKSRAFHIERGKIETETVAFRVTVADAAELEKAEGPASLCAAFTYRGRAAGKVRRPVKLEGLQPAAPAKAAPADVPPRRDAISVEVDASPADLNITVIAQDESDERHFWCRVQTNLLPEYKDGVEKPWITARGTREIVAGYMKDFAEEGIDRFTRLTRLRGAGTELFDAAPAVFRDAFWKLIDGNLKFQTIQIVSSELYIPWELMIPHRPPRGNLPQEFRQPLGVEFRVGRMTRPSLVAGTQKLPLDSCYVIAPVFEGPNSLPHAQKEAAFVLKQIKGDPIDPATLQTVDALLKDCRRVVHFACHGEIEDGRQKIYIGEDTLMSATDLHGMFGAAEGVPRARPLIFLNACKAGQPVPALVGTGGLAAVFAEMGAGAVVAPLWSVKDSIAHEIALEFYARAKSKPAVPFAEILRNLRAKAYDPTVAEDTYAAYCFYGDPLAAPA